MFQQVTDSIGQMMAHNQVFSGGAVLMVGGAIVAYLRNTPQKIMSFLRRFFLMEIYVQDSDTAFRWLVEWLASQQYSKERAMNLAISTKYVNQDDLPRVMRGMPMAKRAWTANSDGDVRVPILSPARGQHMFWYRGRPIWVSRDKDSDGSDNRPPTESMRIFIPSRNRDIVMQILAEAKDIAEPPADDRVVMYRMEREYWQQFTKRQPRPIESVVLRDNLLDELIAEIQEFRSKREWYIERGIPYRKGILLYGPPGTGKSSSVLAIASKLRMAVCVCNPAAAGVNDHSLLVALADTPKDSIVLIEDIDVAFNKERESDDKHNTLTFAGLLNAIDGVAAGDGRIIIATTNHIEKIDPALIRHGRFDRKELFDYPTHDQVSRMYKRFFPSEPFAREDFADKVLATPNVSAAEVQAHLLQWFDDPVAAITNWEKNDGSRKTETACEGIP